MRHTLAVATLFTSLATGLLASTPALAQDVAHDPARTMPMAPPLPPVMPPARDVAYAGTIGLTIDASDIDRGVYRVTQTIPVATGTRDLILLQPGWLPGDHSQVGPFPLLADIHFYADGKEIPWVRDTVAVNAFHLALPEGTREVTARFVHTSPLRESEGRVTMTPAMLNLQWDKMTLYPAGYYTRDIVMKPTVTFPTGWTVYTALDGMARATDNVGANTVTWNAIDFERLVDSPIYAGRNAKRFDLGHNVSLDLVADQPADLAITPEHLAKYHNLVDEALATFGARHFDHYDFLLALSDDLGGIGLEHHRSSENSMYPKSLIDWDTLDWSRNVLPHEFTHSWNGKYRRPADLWTPDYQQPMQTTLLWVYEGQTQFWGYVLAARSGVQSKDSVLGMWADGAARYAEATPGRGWRSVEDTTMAPQLAQRRPLPYTSLTRSEDYYVEGALTWLEADQIIRQGTHGAKGLDDFARAFFGVRDGDWGELTYNFEDVVKTLNGVYPYDWAGFLHTRIYGTNQPAPVKGIEMAGYKLVWKDKPNPYDDGIATKFDRLDLSYSLGMTLGKDGDVVGTVWDGRAYNVGIVNGAKVVAVNGRAYSDAVLKDAITQAKPGGLDAGKPLTFLIRRGDRFQTVPLDYHGGLRWPWLESTAPGKANGFDRLLAPRRK